MAPSLLVFDLDGTLVDSSVDLTTAVNGMLEELGAAPLPGTEVVEMVGDGAGVLVGRALAARRVETDRAEALARFLALYDDCLLDTTRVYDGILDALDVLHGRVPLAVLTNKPAAQTLRILDGQGLRHYFGAVIGGDGPLGRKPDPTGLLDICGGAGVAPDTAVMVGDSPVDLETARAAGSRICLVRYGFGFRFDSAAFRGDELFISSPSELPDALA